MIPKSKLAFNYSPQKIKARVLSKVTLVAQKILLYIERGNGYTGFVPQETSPTKLTTILLLRGPVSYC
jgi:hypothetical protein